MKELIPFNLKPFKKNGLVWLCIVSLAVLTADAQTTLLSENFEGWTSGMYGAQSAGWVSIKVPTSGTQWGTTSLSIAHSGTKSIYAPTGVSDYMITSALTLTANVSYTFSFWYRTYSAGTGFTVNAYIGTAQTVAAMTSGTLLGTFDPNSTVFLQATYTFTPTASGTYYFCVNSSAGSSGPTYTYIDDILITAPSTCTIPCNGWISQNCTTCTKGCYIDGGIISPVRAAQTASITRDTSNYGYVYWAFNASADSTYYFDLCSSTGTAGVSWLRLHNGRNTSPGNNYCMNAGSTPTIVTQNIHNGCAGTGNGLSKLIWTCQQSGTYYLESAIGLNMNPWGASGSQTAVLNYKTLPSSSVTCSDIFYDKGIDGTNGASNSYNNNENWIYTYYPTDTNLYSVTAQFISFSTSPGDILCVYDGSSINAPLVGCYSGPSITGTFSSTANNGSLTFQFTSDDSVVSGGWQANISCGYEGIRNHSENHNLNISVSPNPVKESLVISHWSLGIGDIEIYNTLGEIVSTGIINQHSTINNLSVDVSALLPGIYFIRIENEKGNWNGRFVKQ